MFKNWSQVNVIVFLGIWAYAHETYAENNGPLVIANFYDPRYHDDRRNHFRDTKAVKSGPARADASYKIRIFPNCSESVSYTPSASPKPIVDYYYRSPNGNENAAYTNPASVEEQEIFRNVHNAKFCYENFSPYPKLLHQTKQLPLQGFSLPSLYKSGKSITKTNAQRFRQAASTIYENSPYWHDEEKRYNHRHNEYDSTVEDLLNSASNHKYGGLIKQSPHRQNTRVIKSSYYGDAVKPSGDSNNQHTALEISQPPKGFQGLMVQSPGIVGNDYKSGILPPKAVLYALPMKHSVEDSTADLMFQPPHLKSFGSGLTKGYTIAQSSPIQFFRSPSSTRPGYSLSSLYKPLTHDDVSNRSPEFPYPSRFENPFLRNGVTDFSDSTTYSSSTTMPYYLRTESHIASSLPKTFSGSTYTTAISSSNFLVPYHPISTRLRFEHTQANSLRNLIYISLPEMLSWHKTRGGSWARQPPIMRMAPYYKYKYSTISHSNIDTHPFDYENGPSEKHYNRRNQYLWSLF